MAIAPSPSVTDCTWPWQGLPIRYQTAGTNGIPLVLIHGFGASSDHWRKNIAVLGE
ncbi:MAG: alpha/beta hydrolase, partial [Cyanobacteria bacterium]|nr:alpha/beta hydrolase [Cyanobacteriota bacterium]